MNNPPFNSPSLDAKDLVTTDRLIIRPLQEKDFQSWSESLPSKASSRGEKSVPATQRNPSDFQERLKFYKKLRENDRFYHFAVFDRANPSRMVGAISLTVLERLIIQRGVIGYHIFPNFLRQGYGAEAVKAVMLFAFNELKLHRVEALIEISNRPSSALAIAVGMKKEGTLRKILFDEDKSKWADALLFAAVAEDFGIKGVKPSLRLEIKDH